MCPRAPFRHHRGAIKLHTLLDLRGSIPSFIRITHGRISDLSTLDHLVYEPGAFYVLDRADLDFNRLRRLHQSGASFVTRSLRNTCFACMESRPVPAVTGLLKDQLIRFSGVSSRYDYPAPARRIFYRDPETERSLAFLTNHLDLPALTIAELYRCRWRVELFFKWIKQHLRIKAFYGCSENAVKTQIWIAIAVCVLVAIARKRLGINTSLYSLLQVLSLTLFEKTPLAETLDHPQTTIKTNPDYKQLNPFEF